MAYVSDMALTYVQPAAGPVADPIANPVANPVANNMRLLGLLGSLDRIIKKPV